MQAALDTNLLVYAEGIAQGQGDAAKPDRIRSLLGALPSDEVAVPVQVLGELYRVLVGKAGWMPGRAKLAILAWRDLYTLIDTTASVMAAAVDLPVDHRLSIWDAVILAAAAEAGCRLVLSEDLQEGFTWRGLTVINPLSTHPHPLLDSLMTSRPGA